LESADEIASDDSLPFRFPIDLSPFDEKIPLSWFGRSNECTPDVVGGCYEYPERKFHAAEDYNRPAGTPVYAMADGEISFSGPASGYGWLILIDHPRANLYSLYGHLSPSRWKLKVGTEVQRGDLIGYLGNSDENGGSREQPVQTHLHFGVRTGQVADYPARGEWRYMGGWLKICPQEVGWLQPSVIITSQETLAGGHPQPKAGFLTRWGLELLFVSLYTIGGLFFIAANRQIRFLVLIPGFLFIGVGTVFHRSGLMNSYLLLGVGLLILTIGIYYFIRQPITQQHAQPVT